MKPEATEPPPLMSISRSASSALQRLSISPTFAKFVIVGAIGYLVNQFSLFLLYDSPLSGLLPAKGTSISLLLATHPDVRLLIASAVALEVAIMSNFFWHERWTFKDRAKNRPPLLRFLSFNSTSFGSPLIAFATINVLTPVFGLSPYISNTIGIGLGAAWNWTMNSLVIWPRAREEEAPQS